MKKVSEIQAEYEAKQKEEKAKIKAEPNRFRRFWKWVAYIALFPFKWLWVNIRDWRTALIFGITFLVLSSEVWVPYLIGLITLGTELSAWMFGAASACWLFWLGPGTPFLPLCIGITIGVKGIFNKISEKRLCKKKDQSSKS